MINRVLDARRLIKVLHGLNDGQSLTFKGDLVVGRTQIYRETCLIGTYRRQRRASMSRDELWKHKVGVFGRVSHVEILNEQAGVDAHFKGVHLAIKRVWYRKLAKILDAKKQQIA